MSLMHIMSWLRDGNDRTVTALGRVETQAGPFILIAEARKRNGPEPKNDQTDGCLAKD